MAASDLEVVKDIPGYKVILKAVLKGQIQQLVEQLAVHTDEESIILTASVADGTLSHLGSQAGKGFLENNEDIKSQFLGFCLRNRHRLQSEKGNHGDLHILGSQTLSTKSGHSRASPKLMSPLKQGLSPDAPTRTSPRVRHEPYPVKRNSGRKSLNVEQGARALETKTFSGHVGTICLTDVMDTVHDDMVEVKVECLDSAEESDKSIEMPEDKADEILKQSASEGDVSENKSRFQGEATFQSEDGEVVSEINSKPIQVSEHSNRIIPNFPEGLILDSGLDNFAHHADDEQSKPESDITVKVEAISESDMELEIIGVESQENISKLHTDHSMDMSFDQKAGTSGSEGEGANQQSRNSETREEMERWLEDYMDNFNKEVGGKTQRPAKFQRTMMVPDEDLQQRTATDTGLELLKKVRTNQGESAASCSSLVNSVVHNVTDGSNDTDSPFIPKAVDMLKLGVAGSTSETSSKEYVTFEQLEIILQSYVRKSELRPIKRKVENMEPGANEVEMNTQLEKLIAAQKNPYKAVEAGLMHLFSAEEINSHSATGKKANKDTPAKPKFDPLRFNLMSRLVTKHFNISHKDVILKTQAVKRKCARSSKVSNIDSKSWILN